MNRLVGCLNEGSYWLRLNCCQRLEWEGQISTEIAVGMDWPCDPPCNIVGITDADSALHVLRF